MYLSICCRRGSQNATHRDGCLGAELLGPQPSFCFLQGGYHLSSWWGRGPHLPAQVCALGLCELPGVVYAHMCALSWGEDPTPPVGVSQPPCPSEGCTARGAGRSHALWQRGFVLCSFVGLCCRDRTFSPLRKPPPGDPGFVLLVCVAGLCVQSILLLEMTAHLHLRGWC